MRSLLLWSERSQSLPGRPFFFSLLALKKSLIMDTAKKRPLLHRKTPFQFAPPGPAAGDLRRRFSISRQPRGEERKRLPAFTVVRRTPFFFHVTRKTRVEMRSSPAGDLPHVRFTSLIFNMRRRPIVLPNALASVSILQRSDSLQNLTDLYRQ